MHPFADKVVATAILWMQLRQKTLKNKFIYLLQRRRRRCSLLDKAKVKAERRGGGGRVHLGFEGADMEVSDQGVEERLVFSQTPEYVPT